MISKDYLKYLFQSKKVAWLFFFVMFMGISLSPFIHQAVNVINSFGTCINIASGLAITMTFILPVFLFSFVHRKKSCDVWFALPIRRSHILITTILFSFLIIFGYYAITVLSGMFLPMLSTRLVTTWLFARMGFMVLGILALLLIHSCIFLFANNIFDGIVMILAYLAIPLLVLVVLNSVADCLQIHFLVVSFETQYLSPFWTVLTNYWQIINHFMTLNQDPGHVYGYFFGNGSALQVTVLIGYAALACLGLKKNFVERKTERAEQVSDAFMSYPFIINLYLLLTLMAIAFMSVQDSVETYTVVYLLLFFVYFVAMFVYRRKIRFYWKNVLFFAIACILTIGFANFSFVNKGFGLPYQYPISSATEVNYQYDAYNLNESLKQSDSSSYSVSVHFELSMPVKDINSEKYGEVTEILNQYRKHAVDYHFSKRELYPDTDSSLSVENEDTNGTVSSNYYSDKKVLTVSELKKIAKVTEVTVNVESVYPDQNETSQYSLNDYLKESENGK